MPPSFLPEIPAYRTVIDGECRGGALSPPTEKCLHFSDSRREYAFLSPLAIVILHCKITGRVLQSAADLLIIMIAGGNHTTIYSEALPYNKFRTAR